MVTREEIEVEAKILAQDYVQSEPSLKAVYWFPDQSNSEIRIIDVVEGYFAADTIDKIDVFIFNHAIKDQPIKLLIGTVPPSLENKPVIPNEWGDWNQAVKVYGWSMNIQEAFKEQAITLVFI